MFLFFRLGMSSKYGRHLYLPFFSLATLKKYSHSQAMRVFFALPTKKISLSSLYISFLRNLERKNLFRKNQKRKMKQAEFASPVQWHHRSDLPTNVATHFPSG